MLDIENVLDLKIEKSIKPPPEIMILRKTLEFKFQMF